MDGGNFGAVPNPPLRRSYSPSIAAAAPSSTSSSTTDAGSAAVCRLSSPTILVADSRTSVDRSVHASCTASSSCGNDGMPCRGDGG
jgi:hypothetical protein